MDLHSTRGRGMAIQPISFVEIQAYLGMYQITPQAWEIELLRKFDIAYLNYQSDQEAKKT